MTGEPFAGLSPAQLADLRAALIVGRDKLQTDRRRNGGHYDPTGANVMLAALDAAARGQRRPETRQGAGPWVTVAKSVSVSSGVSGRTVRRWAASGRIRSQKIHPRLLLVHRGDVERERKKR